MKRCYTSILESSTRTAQRARRAARAGAWITATLQVPYNLLGTYAGALTRSCLVLSYVLIQSASHRRASHGPGRERVAMAGTHAGRQFNSQRFTRGVEDGGPGEHALFERAVNGRSVEYSAGDVQKKHTRRCDVQLCAVFYWINS